MGFPFSGILPSNELTLEEKRAFRTDALNAIQYRALDVKKIGNDPKEIVIRDILPDTDLGLANRWWLTPALVAGAATAYVNAALAAFRALCIYGVSVESAAPACSIIYFRSGPAGATTKGLGNLESLYSKLETDGYLSKAVLWDPQETVFIQVWARLTVAGGERMPLRGFVVEPVGEAISGPVM